MSNDRGQRSIRLEVTDWPNIGRTSTLSLDPTIAASEQAITDYCRDRYGDGKLRGAGTGKYIYRRARSLPGDLLWMISRLLHKSY